MARRSRSSQTLHDAKVKSVAASLKRKGYKVRADLPGYKEKPRKIGGAGKRPDIEATRSGTRRIIEVETTKSLKSDTEQLKTFVRHAAQKNRTTFDIVVAKSKRK